MIGTTVEDEEAAVAGMVAGTAGETGLAATSDDNDDDDEETDDAGKVCAFNCHFSVGTAW